MKKSINKKTQGFDLNNPFRHFDNRYRACYEMSSPLYHFMPFYSSSQITDKKINN